jgi:hypothetical protein
MSDKRAETVQGVELLIESMADARRAIRASEVAMRRALKKVNQGVDVTAALAAAQPASTRQMVNDALTTVEQSRHAMRLKIFAYALDEGMTIAELARAWGFSRQLAARYAKEARAAAA